MFKKLILLLTLLFLAVVYTYTVFGREPMAEPKVILEPFQTLKDIKQFNYISHGQYIMREVVLNVILLMPLGFLLTCIHWHILLVTLLGFLTSLSIEVLQYYTCTGTFEVDDLIYNTTGVFLVSVVVTLLQKLRHYAEQENT